MKRSKILSVLLAALIIMSSFSCLSTVSFAANLDIGAEYDSENNIVQKFWELDTDGVLTILKDCEPTWVDHADKIKKVIVCEGVTTIPDKSFYECINLETFDATLAMATLTQIGGFAFSGCTKLTEIKLPIFVSSLGEYAFSNCDNLKKADVGASLEMVGANVFKGCASLEEVVIGNGCKTIGEGMFEDCSVLKTIALPDSISTIGKLAFENCTALESVIIPDSVTTVGEYAFYGCTAVKTAYIGHNVNTVGEFVFGECTSLETVDIQCAMPAISDGMFYGCTSLKGITNLPEGIKTIGENAFAKCSAFDAINIPTTVSMILDSAFESTAIKTIDIPGNVEAIGDGVFSNCDALEAINVDSTNPSYRSVDGVLYSADMKTLITCPAGKSGDVTIPGSVETIVAGAFLGCKSIATVVIPGSVESISEIAFNGCADTLVIETPCNSAAAAFATVHSIDVNLIHSETTKWVVTVEPDCENTGTREKRCDACEFVLGTETLDKLGHSYDTGVVTKEATCEADGEMTFTCQREGCTDSYIVPIPAIGHKYGAGVVTKKATCDVDGETTYYCQNDGCGDFYTTPIPATGHKYSAAGVVTKDATCEAEGEKTFYCQNDGCSSSYVVAIPRLEHEMDAGTVTKKASCTEKGEIVYECTQSGCDYKVVNDIPATGHKLDKGNVTTEPDCVNTGVKTYTCENDDCDYEETTIIPALGHTYDGGVITKYATVNENGVKTFTCEVCDHTYTESIPNIAFDGILATNKEAYANESNEIVDLSWMLTDAGVLTIYKDVAKNEWAPYALLIKTVIITGETTTVNNSAFAGYENLEEVIFTTTLAKICAGAFQDCDKLTALQIPGTTSIEDYAFYDCDNIVSVELYGGLAQNQVGKNIFKSCDKLESLVIKNGAIEIGEGMFEDCTALKTIDLPDSLVKIGRLAFENCSALENIIVPDSVVSVGEYAFYDCSSVKTAYIGHNVNEVGEFVFGNCTALEDVEIKCAMPAISDGMFYGCSSLKGLAALPEGIKVIGKKAFEKCTAFAEIDLPATVTDIADSAFDSTDITVIEIPGNVENIGSGVFSNCKKLEAINVDAKNRNYASIDGVLYNAALTEIICCPAGKQGTVVVPETVSKIGVEAFIGCTGLEVVEISASVTDIANTAFNGCSEELVIKTVCSSFAADFAERRGINTDITHDGDIIWVVTKEPTCLVGGVRQQMCSACEFVYATEDLEALGHTYDDGVVITKATCEADGVIRYICKRDCGYYYEEPISATGHDWDDGTVTKEATCDEDGSIVYSCENGCGSTKTETIDKLGHNMDGGTVKTEAACGVTGEVVYVCQNGCGHETTEEIEALSHSYVVTATRKGTCITEGYIEYKCELCGDTYVEKAYGDHVLYSSAVRVEPTCEKDGKEGKKCSLCGEFVGKVKVLPATGHNFKQGYCTDCGKKDNRKAPAQPKLVKAYNSARGPVIYWEEVKDVDEYNIYVFKNGNWKVLATVKAEKGKTSYVHTKAKSGTTYLYSVSAVKDGVESKFNKKGLELLCLDDPKLKGIANTEKGVKVTWYDINGEEGYYIYRRTATTDWKRIATVKAGVTKYVDKTAKSGNGYLYTVRAINGKVKSSYNHNGINILFLATPEVKSVKAGSSYVKATWEKVSGAKKYVVYRKTGSGAWVKVATVSKSASSYKDTTVKSGKTYTYTVRAVNGSVKSAYDTTTAKAKFK